MAETNSRNTQPSDFYLTIPETVPVETLKAKHRKNSRRECLPEERYNTPNTLGVPGETTKVKLLGKPRVFRFTPELGEVLGLSDGSIEEINDKTPRAQLEAILDALAIPDAMDEAEFIFRLPYGRFQCEECGGRRYWFDRGGLRRCAACCPPFGALCRAVEGDSSGNTEGL